MTNRKTVALFVLSVMVLQLLLWLNLRLGSVHIPANLLWSAIWGDGVEHEAYTLIIHHFRIPQMLTAMLTGAALSVAGLLLQTLFRNPLADPSILGISSGASLGVALFIFANSTLIGHTHYLPSAGPFGIISASFIGAVTVLVTITAISKWLSSMTTLLIAGIMVAYLAGAATGIIKYFSNREDLQAFVVWGMGTFANVSRQDLPLFTSVVTLGLLLSIFMIKPLNIFLLGELYAANLGLKVRFFSLMVLLLAGFLTAVTTAYTGPIAFIGLAVPHLARNLYRTSKHDILIPAAMLLGACLALFCNLIARIPGFDSSLPVNSITSIIGAPIVIYVLIKRYKSMPYNE